MFRFSVLFFILGYVIVIVILLAVSTSYFVRQTDITVKSNIESIAYMSLSRTEYMLMSTINSLETANRRFVSNMETFNVTASAIPSTAPITAFSDVFQLMGSGLDTDSIVYQQEVWWNNISQAYDQAGCSSTDKKCRRTDGVTNLTYAVGYDIYGKLDFDQVVVTQGTVTPGNIHSVTMERPVFKNNSGYWSPLIVREASAPPCSARCGDVCVQYNMFFYRCIVLDEENVDPETGLMGCNDAVVSATELRYISRLQGLGISNNSLTVLVSPNYLNPTNTPCGDLPEKRKVEVRKFVAEGKSRLQYNSELNVYYYQKFSMDSKHTYTSGLYTTDTGIMFVYSDVGDSSVFLNEIEKARTINIVVTVVIVVLIVAMSLFMWWRIGLPIRRACRCLLRAGSGDKPRSLGSIVFCCPTLVKEIHELYQVYLQLDTAVRELRAFAPQGLFMPEGDKGGGEGDDLDATELNAEALREMEQAFAPWSSLRHPSRSHPPPTAVDSSWSAAEEKHTASFNSSGEPPVALVDVVLADSSGARPSTTSSSDEKRKASLEVALSIPEAAEEVEGTACVSARQTNLRLVSCTLVLISRDYPFVDPELLSAAVQQFLGVIVKSANDFGGIVEVLRPDFVVVSFGCHTNMPMHVKYAAMCAISITRRLSPEQRARTRTVMDTSEFFTGICGARNRFSRALYGDHFDFLLALRHHSMSLGRVLVTDRVASCCSRELLVPLDNVIPRAMGSSAKFSVQLYQLLDPSTLNAPMAEARTQLRKSFEHALHGRYEEGLAAVQAAPQADTALLAFVEESLRTLATSIPRRPRFCHFQLPAFEVLGNNGGFNASLNRGKLYRPLVVSNAHRSQKSSSAPVQLTSGGASGSGDGSEIGGPNPLPNHEGSDNDSGSFSFFSILGLSANADARESGSALAAVSDTIGSGGALSSNAFRGSRGEVWHVMQPPIGCGGFSQVYKAISELGSLAALKHISLDSHTVNLDDVEEEVNTSCKLVSQFIVNYYDWVHQDNSICIIMEYMPGGTLKDVLTAFPSGLVRSVIRRYALDILKGLAYLHRNGIVHADLKPQNILIAMDGTCKISDFGSSLTKARAASYAGDVFNLRGTPLYMSPEVAGGEAPSVHSDMWSFGITLHEVITGALPWVWKETREPVLPPLNVVGVTATAAPVSVFKPEPGTPPARKRKFSPTRFLQSLHNGDVITVVQRDRIPFPDIANIIESCLDVNPSKRPTSEDLLYSSSFN